MINARVSCHRPYSNFIVRNSIIPCFKVSFIHSLAISTEMAAQQDLGAKEREKLILDRQLNGLPSGEESNSKQHVFAYATASDKVILSISSVCAVLAGALNPLVPVRVFTVLDILHCSFANVTTCRSFTASWSQYSMASKQAPLPAKSYAPKYPPLAYITSISASHSLSSRTLRQWDTTTPANE